MRYHISKFWSFKFRRDPDAGRVLFLGPLVLHLDVVRFPASRALRLCWTCSDACHAEHSNKLAARLHWIWLRATRRA